MSSSLVPSAAPSAGGTYDPAICGPPPNVDVRDVARAHVLVLRLPRSEASGAKGTSTRHYEKRSSPRAGRYAERWRSVLGMKIYVKQQDTVLDTVDDLLRIEKVKRAT
ncbi:hypothetical protein BJY52DRAFT_1183982 [Lactarius psammicola]|nr:hypothetical protein BJY52DRAFT_1183982 [Lactarius psammicola]